MQLQLPRPRNLFLGFAVLLPLTAALAPRGTTISFAPQEGLSLTKTFSQVLTAEIADLTVSMNDEEMELEGRPEMSIQSTEMIAITDTYTAVEGGRPTKLTRFFDELARSRSQEFDGESIESEETSELEGKSVLFEWDGDEESYEVRFSEDDEDADEDLLADLFGDADLLGFMPKEEVEEGDTWSVELIDYRRLFSASGDLVFLDEEGESSKDEIDELLDDNLEGEIECTFGGVEDVDDVLMALIEFTVEIESDAETSGDLGIDDPEVSSGVEVSEISTSSEFEGTIYFNLRAGHIASVEIVGETEFNISEGVEIELHSGETFNQMQTMVFEGELEVEITFE